MRRAIRWTLGIAYICLIAFDIWDHYQRDNKELPDLAFWLVGIVLVTGIGLTFIEPRD